VVTADELIADVRWLQEEKASTKEKIFQLAFEFLRTSCGI